MNLVEIYALMARCLKGESSEKEDRKLSEALFADPSLMKEFELLKETIFHFRPAHNDTSIYTDAHLQTKFDSITKKLKDEGAL
jgi:hypothetical protein